ncbi:hypothetical protein PR048_013207 [Dryococelus australis]|uniref:Uncharacterized protein n=1 Tax=Dryococelus australis TaxID=614101 RepID=A0ABQ9HRH9_9NEOP|nr:hypothetical protein PR048_013207 [Dryococelus australis]
MRTAASPRLELKTNHRRKRWDKNSQPIIFQLERINSLRNELLEMVEKSGSSGKETLPHDRQLQTRKSKEERPTCCLNFIEIQHIDMNRINQNVFPIPGRCYELNRRCNDRSGGNCLAAAHQNNLVGTDQQLTSPDDQGTSDKSKPLCQSPTGQQATSHLPIPPPLERVNKDVQSELHVARVAHSPPALSSACGIQPAVSAHLVMSTSILYLDYALKDFFPYEVVANVHMHQSFVVFKILQHCDGCLVVLGAHSGQDREGEVSAVEGEKHSTPTLLVGTPREGTRMSHWLLSNPVSHSSGSRSRFWIHVPGIPDPALNTLCLRMLVDFLMGNAALPPSRMYAHQEDISRRLPSVPRTLTFFCVSLTLMLSPHTSSSTRGEGGVWLLLLYSLITRSLRVLVFEPPGPHYTIPLVEQAVQLGCCRVEGPILRLGVQVGVCEWLEACNMPGGIKIKQCDSVVNAYVTISYLASAPRQTVQRQASHGPTMAAYAVHISRSALHANDIEDLVSDPDVVRYFTDQGIQTSIVVDECSQVPIGEHIATPRSWMSHVLRMTWPSCWNMLCRYCAAVSGGCGRYCAAVSGGYGRYCAAVSGGLRHCEWDSVNDGETVFIIEVNWLWSPVNAGVDSACGQLCEQNRCEDHKHGHHYLDRQGIGESSPLNAVWAGSARHCHDEQHAHAQGCEQRAWHAANCSGSLQQVHVALSGSAGMLWGWQRRCRTLVDSLRPA